MPPSLSPADIEWGEPLHAMRLTASNPGARSITSLFCSVRKILPFFLLMLFPARAVWAQATVESAGATTPPAAAAVQASLLFKGPATPAADENDYTHTASQVCRPAP